MADALHLPANLSPSSNAAAAHGEPAVVAPAAGPSPSTDGLDEATGRSPSRTHVEGDVARRPNPIIVLSPRLSPTPPPPALDDDDEELAFRDAMFSMAARARREQLLTINEPEPNLGLEVGDEDENEALLSSLRAGSSAQSRRLRRITDDEVGGNEAENGEADAGFPPPVFLEDLNARDRLAFREFLAEDAVRRGVVHLEPMTPLQIRTTAIENDRFVADLLAQDPPTFPPMPVLRDSNPSITTTTSRDRGPPPRRPPAPASSDAIWRSNLVDIPRTRTPLPRGGTARDASMLPSLAQPPTSTARLDPRSPHRSYRQSAFTDAPHRTLEDTNSLIAHTGRSRKIVHSLYCGAHDNDELPNGWRWSAVGSSSNAMSSGCGALVCARALSVIGDDHADGRYGSKEEGRANVWLSDLPPSTLRLGDIEAGALGDRPSRTRRCRTCAIYDLGCKNCGNVVGFRIAWMCVECRGNCQNGARRDMLFRFNARSVTETPRRISIVPAANLSSCISSDEVYDLDTLEQKTRSTPDAVTGRIEPKSPVFGAQMRWEHLPHPQDDFEQGLVSEVSEWLDEDSKSSWWATHGVSKHLDRYNAAQARRDASTSTLDSTAAAATAPTTNAPRRLLSISAMMRAGLRRHVMDDSDDDLAGEDGDGAVGGRRVRAMRAEVPLPDANGSVSASSRTVVDGGYGRAYRSRERSGTHRQTAAARRTGGVPQLSGR